jgi:hypothetical protein
MEQRGGEDSSEACHREAMVSCRRPLGKSTTKCLGILGGILTMLTLSGCKNACQGTSPRGHRSDVHKGVVKKVVHANDAEGTDMVSLGEVRVGQEALSFYVAYGYDSAILGFSVSTGAGRVRYFPIYGSTDRGIPSGLIEVFVSEREDEIWVRSSWTANEVLAYHRVGSETAQSGWGELRFFDTPMPESIGGGPLPYPALPKTAVKIAAYDYQDEGL